MSESQGDLARPRPTSPGERTHPPVGGDPRPRRAGVGVEDPPSRGEVAAGVRGGVGSRLFEEMFPTSPGEVDGARSWGEVHRAGIESAIDAMVAILRRRNRFGHERVFDAGVEASGFARENVANVVRSLRRFGLVWTVGPRMRDLELTVLGRRWLEAIPAGSVEA